MEGVALETLTSDLVSVTLSGESGDTTLVISGTGAHQFRWGLATNESDASSYGGSHTINPSGFNWTIYMRFQTTLSKFGATQNNTWTATNNSVAVARNIQSSAP